jgi:hypothetical protein
VDTPLINGNRYSFASIELNVAGRRFIGFSEINYSDNLEPGEVRGAHAQPLGHTQGDYSSEASITMYEEEFNELLDVLGDNFRSARFSVVVSYADEGQKVVTDEIVGCHIGQIEKSRSQGTDGLGVPVTLHPHFIKWNGRNPLPRMLGQ